MTVTAPAKTALDSRREKSAAAHAAAEKARAGVTELEQRLQNNSSLTKQQTQALRNAVAEANRLKRALKNAAKERTRLTKERKRAQSRAEKSEAKAKAAEARYDKSVLAEMVKREKERDRQAAVGGSADGKALQPVRDRAPVPIADAAASTRSPATRGRKAAPARSRTAVADPPPEKPDNATATAARTAARKTAATARKTAAAAGSTRTRTSRTRTARAGGAR
jgi:hypothetical protein